MVMCSKCHKRVAVVFVNKIENGNKSSEGLCIKCARELGIPVDNMLGNMMNQMGLSPDQLDNMEADINQFLSESHDLPSDSDDLEDGGAPAIDLPQLFKDGNLPVNASSENGSAGGKKAPKGEAT
jgi:ATP-dependent Clp protease ATP-binding subunit ClpB